MKNILLITMVAGLGLFASACGGAATNNSTANNAATAKAPEKKEEKPVVTLKPGEVPFDGMSNVATTAKAGEIVLTIDESKIAEIAGGAKDPTANYQNRVKVKPGRHVIELASRGVTRRQEVDVPKGGYAVVSLMALR